MDSTLSATDAAEVEISSQSHRVTASRSAGGDCRREESPRHGDGMAPISNRVSGFARPISGVLRIPERQDGPVEIRAEIRVEPQGTAFADGMVSSRDLSRPHRNGAAT